MTAYGIWLKLQFFSYEGNVHVLESILNKQCYTQRLGLGRQLERKGEKRILEYL